MINGPMGHNGEMNDAQERLVNFVGNPVKSPHCDPHKITPKSHHMVLMNV